MGFGRGGKGCFCAYAFLWVSADVLLLAGSFARGAAGWPPPSAVCWLRMCSPTVVQLQPFLLPAVLRAGPVQGLPAAAHPWCLGCSPAQCWHTSQVPWLLGAVPWCAVANRLWEGRLTLLWLLCTVPPAPAGALLRSSSWLWV